MAGTANRVEVLVVGAGPSGLTAASELARHGVNCRIVDKKSGPVDHSQALGVQVRTREVFDAMGISSGWTEAGAAFEKMILTAYGEHLATIDVTGVDSFYDHPLAVGQNVTERLLSENLQRLGVSVERLTEATSYVEHEDYAEVSIKHPDGSSEIVHADFVISAEGSGSMIRDSLGIAFEGERYEGVEFVQAEAEIHWTYPNRNSARAFLSKGHGVIFFPFKEENFYRIICFRPDANPGDRTPPTIEEIQALVREYADKNADLCNPRWLNRFRCQCRAAKTLRKGRAFLIGDAGHVHVPIGGQGMNTGIQDGFNLAWKLAYYLKGISPSTLLDSYNDERHRNALALVKKTDAAFHALLGATTVNELLVKVIGSTVMNSELVQRKLRYVMAEFDVKYRDSACVADHGGGSGPRAGDRAPDALVVRMPEKKAIRIFDAMRHTNWTLFYFSGKNLKDESKQTFAGIKKLIDDEYKSVISLFYIDGNANYLDLHNSPGVVLVDRECDAHDHYGADHSLLVLVRPDWYIAFRAKGTQSAELEKFLGKIFKPTLPPVSIPVSVPG